MKHIFYLALAISVGVAVSKIFGGTFNIGGLLSGLGTTTTTSTTTCWLAAVAFDEDFVTGPRVNKVRTWLHNDFEKSGPGQRMLMNLYRAYGERAARKVQNSRILKAGVKIIFTRALLHAEAKYGIAA
jgi:hypothetical protein